jgi:hypothetical protein
MPGFADGSGESVSIDPEGDRIIAFGSDMWVSTDGDTWQQTEQQEPNIQPYWDARLAWDGDRIVAGVPDAHLSLWVSGDRGSTWSRIDPDDPAFAGSPAVHSVTRLGDIFVAVGLAGAYSQEVSAVWIGTWDD